MDGPIRKAGQRSLFRSSMAGGRCRRKRPGRRGVDGALRASSSVEPARGAHPVCRASAGWDPVRVDPQHDLFAVSPDGRRLAFVARSADGRDFLWVRSLAEPSAVTLPGTEGAAAPFWSPDSRFIAFFADGKLKKIDSSGGPPVTLCDVSRALSVGLLGKPALDPLRRCRGYRS